MTALVLLLAIGPMSAAPAVEYHIQRAGSPITIDARLDEPAWRNAPPTSDFVFNWYTSGDKEPTEAKLLWDDDNLYVSWRCSDRHISAFERERHGPVSKDDCVEIFLSPNPAKVRNYYTFEINAIGTMLNRCRTDWWTGPPTWEPEGVQYHTTFHGLARKEESPGDKEWIVELAIPFANFSRDAAHTPPRDGDEWRLNLTRIGGQTNPQASTWSPIPPPSRSFHTPENFGKVVFLAQAQNRRGGAGGFAREAPPSQQDVAAGKALYNANCTMCHGLNGEQGDRAPALGARRNYLRRTSADLFDAVKNGIKGTLMPASPLPAADVNKIVAYIRSLRATAADAPAEGNVAGGEAIFNGKGGCIQCHMIDGRGGILGPDLSNIAAERKLDDIQAALTRRKPVIPRGFRPVHLTTLDGREIRGVLKNENNFSLQILGMDGKLHMLPRADVRQLTYEPESLMPSDFDKKLSKVEFQDLLAFLSRQTRRQAR
ncbi:MAG: c-type cytochrome [Bryobacterales bacterium]|nr:c-type cytochrome [Bryobacterales bacterium]